MTRTFWLLIVIVLLLVAGCDTMQTELSDAAAYFGRSKKWEWALFIVIVAIVWIIRNKEVERRLLPLAELFDDRRFKKGGIFQDTMSGLFRGQPTLFIYEGRGGGQFARDPEFHVRITCRTQFSFVFSSDAVPYAFTNWKGHPEIAEKVTSLVVAAEMNSLQLANGFLKVSYVGDP